MRVARTNLPLASLSGLAALSALACASSSERARRWLEQAGEVVACADTFEAVGIRRDEANGQIETSRLRTVLGPNGEYRLQRNDRVVVHDSHYVAFLPAYDYGGLAPRDARSYQPRTGRWNRWPGDIVMSAVMPFEGKGDTYLAYMRVLGADWVNEALPQGTARMLGRERVDGRARQRVRVVIENHSVDFWIDAKDRLVRRYEVGVGGFRSSVEYTHVHINRPVSASLFAIPQEVLGQAACACDRGPNSARSAYRREVNPRRQ